MTQSHADPSLTTDDHPLADYKEDGYEEKGNPDTVEDDEPTGPDDFNPPTAGGSGSERH